MKLRNAEIIIAITITLLTGAPVKADSAMGQAALQLFDQAIHEYFNIPNNDLAAISNYGIRPDEMPVVLYLAREANVPPVRIIDLHRAGSSWFSIARNLGLSPEIFYVPLRVDVEGPPYGHAYGYYRNHTGTRRAVILNDDDVTNMVNLRFLSEYHRRPAEDVVALRQRGRDFVIINQQFKGPIVKEHGKEHFGKDHDQDEHEHQKSHKNKHGKGHK